MTRNICITAADGNTGFLIAELILTDNDFKKKVDSVSVLALHPEEGRAKELADMGAKVLPHLPGKTKEMVKTMKESGCDTICMIPPAHKDKFNLTVELINVAKEADIPNFVMISSAGCDLAERDKQPNLRQFVDLEALAMSGKGEANTSLGHSPCIIRAGFYAENLLNYAPQAQKEGVLPLPVGTNHLFAPVALGDIALLAAHVLTGQGPNGLDDRHRGQLMVLTGPTLCTGDLMAQHASKALGSEMKFQNISEAEAKKVLKAQSESDQSELDYLLEYYSLVREGKTNYISTNAFHDVTGSHPQQPVDFFKVYAESFKSQDGEDAHKAKKRKTG